MPNNDTIDDSGLVVESAGLSDHLKYKVPHRSKQKITIASDAVELVRSGDTVIGINVDSYKDYEAMYMGDKAIDRSNG